METSPLFFFAQRLSFRNFARCSRLGAWCIANKKKPIGDERRSAHEILSHSPKRALWCMQNCSKSKNRNWLILFRSFVFFVVEFSVESEAHWSKKLSACSNRKWHLVRAAMQCNNVSSTSLFLRLLFDAKWARYFSLQIQTSSIKTCKTLVDARRLIA